MKPDTHIAMRQLIIEVKASIPFDMPDAQVCAGGCRGCSKKLLNFLETELDEWESRLGEGESPSFGEIESLSKTCKKIYKALCKSGLLVERKESVN